MALKEVAPVLKDMPLSQVPERGERLEKVEKTSLLIAQHELNHALVALNQRILPELVSTIPAGDSLGRNVFYGRVDLEAFKVIAAAGMVDIPDAPAAGYGMDALTIESLLFYYGGESRELAKMQAQSILLGYPAEVKRRAAEILAYLREVPGWMIPQILERARVEIEVEEGRVEMGVPSLIDWVTEDEDRISREKYPDEKTIIEDLGNGQYRAIYIRENQEEEYTYCSFCDGIGGHRRDCPFLNSFDTAAKNKKKVADSEVRGKVESYFQKKGTIFSNN